MLVTSGIIERERKTDKFKPKTQSSLALSTLFIKTMATTLPFLTKPAETNTEIKSVCVFCGSGSGADPIYEQEAFGM